MSKFCPDKFEPLAKDIEWGKQEFRVTEDELYRQLALMRDHEFRRSYTDWNRVFRNWLRKADEIQTFRRERKYRQVEELSEQQRLSDAQKAWADMKQLGAKQ